MSIIKTNQLPMGVAWDAETNTSTIFDRLYRPVVTLPQKWPRCDHSQAQPCDGPPMYGVKPIAMFMRPDDINATIACPATRQRLRSLIAGMPALRLELRRRQVAAEEAEAIAMALQPSKRAEGLELISKTFPLTSNVIAQ